MTRRLAVVVAAALALLALTVVLYRVGPDLNRWSPGCLLHQLTGCYCAGCGMTRAAWHLLHFEPVKAFRMNPLMVVLTPVVALGVALEVAAWVRGPERPTPQLRPGWRTTVALVVVLLAYGVLRNLPWWPFTLLAPH